MMLRKTGAAIIAICLSVPAFTNAQPSPPAPDQGNVKELVDLFTEACIHDFPDKAALDKFIAAKSATVMQAVEVKRYLHEDPGAAWYFKSSDTLYALTIEEPPFHTCAIRRMTPLGTAGPEMRTLTDGVKAYASSIGGKAMNLQPNTTHTANGPDVLSFGTGVLDASGKPSDTFGVFISNYHGRVPEPWGPDAKGRLGVEVRLSRQVLGR